MVVMFNLEEKTVSFSLFYPMGFARIHSEWKWFLTSLPAVLKCFFLIVFSQCAQDEAAGIMCICLVGDFSRFDYKNPL